MKLSEQSLSIIESAAEEIGQKIMDVINELAKK